MGLAPGNLSISPGGVAPAGVSRRRQVPSPVTREMRRSAFTQPRRARWGRISTRNRLSVGTLWDKFADDHGLMGVKVALLGGLILLTALLEQPWAR
jgi:hypothetical protein